jgi:hypothetical protein
MGISALPSCVRPEPYPATDRSGTRLRGGSARKTRVYIRETYEEFNPLMRALLDDKLIEASLVRSLNKFHKRERGGSAGVA